MKLDDDQLLHRIQWVRDLISGEYAQTKSTLKRYDGDEVSYCCLGVVLCHLDPHTVLLQRMSGPLSQGVALYHNHRLALGMTDDEQNALMGYNDDGTSFERIADLIAYATARLRRIDRDPGKVPEGYAREWLEWLDATAASA